MTLSLLEFDLKVSSVAATSLHLERKVDLETESYSRFFPLLLFQLL